VPEHDPGLRHPDQLHRLRSRDRSDWRNHL